jgi:hypothetical protein
VFIALAAAHAAVLVATPTVPIIALGVWWNSNTIAHNFIHRPFFRRRLANEVFAACLSLLLGIPQALWREHHLAHHGGVRPHPRLSAELTVQVALVLALWTVMAARSPKFFLATYLPGYLAGLALCALHGHYEHARGATSHYGALYNLLLFNDGYHVEHHANPGLPWSRLPQSAARPGRTSAWPAPLRWMERFGLDALERFVLRSRMLQQFALRTHARAMRDLLGALPPIDRVAVVGGGLFPRTFLILSELLPSARITIIDADRDNLARARELIGDADVELVHARYDARGCGAFDLIVFPLSFDGNRRGVYEHPPAPLVLVHDWIWRRRGDSRIVSVALIKRINLVRR